MSTVSETDIAEPSPPSPLDHDMYPDPAVVGKFCGVNHSDPPPPYKSEEEEEEEEE